MKQNMDDGELEPSDNVLLGSQDFSGNFQNLEPVDSFLDELLKNTRTCTHTHTCNPPGPDEAHTHTCYHTHTQVIASEEDNHSNIKEHSSLKPRRSSGNREAVRKYREKKKAHTAYLEEEVKKLHVLNQQLVRKLQGQAILEAELLRLRSLLVDFKGKIDNELGAFPYQKQCNGVTILKDGDCGLQSNGGTIGLHCHADLPCFHPQAGSTLHAGIGGSEQTLASWEGNCRPPIIDCRSPIIDCQTNTHDVVSTERQTLDAAEALVSSSSLAELPE